MTVPVLALGNNDVQPRYPAPAPAGQPDAWIKRTTAGWPILVRLLSETGPYMLDNVAATSDEQSIGNFLANWLLRC